MVGRAAPAGEPHAGAAQAAIASIESGLALRAVRRIRGRGQHGPPAIASRLTPEEARDVDGGQRNLRRAADRSPGPAAPARVAGGEARCRSWAERQIIGRTAGAVRRVAITTGSCRCGSAGVPAGGPDRGRRSSHLGRLSPLKLLRVLLLAHAILFGLLVVVAGAWRGPSRRYPGRVAAGEPRESA